MPCYPTIDLRYDDYLEEPCISTAQLEWEDHILVQTKNPKSNRYVKINKSTGEIVSTKKSEGPYKNIKIVGIEKSEFIPVETKWYCFLCQRFTIQNMRDEPPHHCPGCGATADEKTIKKNQEIVYER
uniref:Uncharacterized protein n=1 Tax=viral metagenome TaxID=1070528 RepID=A0A6M3J973_9ZZZZ